MIGPWIPIDPDNPPNGIVLVHVINSAGKSRRMKAKHYRRFELPDSPRLP